MVQDYIVAYTLSAQPIYCRSINDSVISHSVYEHQGEPLIYISVSCSVDFCAAANIVAQSWDATQQASELVHHTLHAHHWQNACCSAKLITWHKWALLVFDLDARISTNVTILANIYIYIYICISDYIYIAWALMVLYLNQIWAPMTGLCILI